MPPGDSGEPPSRLRARPPSSQKRQSMDARQQGRAWACGATWLQLALEATEVQVRRLAEEKAAADAARASALEAVAASEAEVAASRAQREGAERRAGAAAEAAADAADAADARARAAKEEARAAARQRAQREAALETTRVELGQARARAEGPEGEMVVVLRAMEVQKQTAQRNMAQLSRLCSDWRQQGTVPEGDE